MGKVTLLSVAVFCVVASKAISEYISERYSTPTNCSTHLRLDDGVLLMPVTTVDSRIACALECSRNAGCASLTTTGKEPDVTCRLYQQTMNRYGLYATIDPAYLYLEKRLPIATTLGHYRTHACEKINAVRDPTKMCDARDHELFGGEWLLVDEVLCSENRMYKAAMQGDSNLVIYEIDDNAWQNTGIKWSSDTTGFGGVRARLLDNGQLVIEDGGGNSVFATNNTGPLWKMQLTDGGVLQILSRTGVIWSTE